MNPLNRPQIHLGITTAFQVLILISLLAILTTPSISHAAFPGTNGKIAFWAVPAMAVLNKST